MPAAIKRRKVSATNSKNASSLGSKPSGLDAFTRVGKANSAGKAILEKNNFVDSIATTNYSLGEKRKLVEIDEETTTEQPPTIEIAPIERRNIKPLPQRNLEALQSFPKTPNKPIADAQSFSDTPTNGARSLLNQLFVSKAPTKSAFSKDGIYSTRPQSISTPPQELPTELLDLINLHAAFLTALSLHYAHNGTHSPADLRLLCPNVARTWGKRGVTLEDIRRSLGVMNGDIPEDTKDNRISRLSLSDYGHGKICIEIRTGTGKTGRLPRPVNENLLNEIFVDELKKAWKERTLEEKLEEFIEALPLEPITPCSSLSKMSPLLAKGQRRLEDLKSGIIIKNTTKEKKPLIETTNSARPTLLERLRAKQLQRSTLPPPPSKEELARKAALQRLDEVVAVLTMISTSTSLGQQRISFTLPTILGKLKDSFKTPISKEEGATAVRLLAQEIAPEWVRIVKMGKVEAVVVNRDGRPSEIDIKERVKGAVGTTLVG